MEQTGMVLETRRSTLLVLRLLFMLIHLSSDRLDMLGGIDGWTLLWDEGVMCVLMDLVAMRELPLPGFSPQPWCCPQIPNNKSLFLRVLSIVQLVDSLSFMTIVQLRY